MSHSSSFGVFGMRLLWMYYTNRTFCDWDESLKLGESMKGSVAVCRIMDFGLAKETQETVTKRG